MFTDELRVTSYGSLVTQEQEEVSRQLAVSAFQNVKMIPVKNSLSSDSVFRFQLSAFALGFASRYLRPHGLRFSLWLRPVSPSLGSAFSFAPRLAPVAYCLPHLQFSSSEPLGFHLQRVRIFAERSCAIGQLRDGR